MLTADVATTQIASVIGTDKFELLRRDRRWVALASDRVAHVADDDAGWQRLLTEHWLIDRWRAAAVPVPRVIAERAPIQVRERLDGITGDVVEPMLFGGALPVDRYAETTPLSSFGARLAESYGALASRIRRAVSPSAASGFTLGTRRTLDVDTALTALRASHASARAKSAASRVKSWLGLLPPANALIHGDLHFHNMCLASDGAIIGVFDFDEAGIDSPATELLYIHSLGPKFVERALAAYGPHDLDDVRRAHLRTVLDHVLRYGPGTPRHESIVAWASTAFEALA